MHRSRENVIKKSTGVPGGNGEHTESEVDDFHLAAALQMPPSTDGRRKRQLPRGRDLEMFRASHEQSVLGELAVLPRASDEGRRTIRAYFFATRPRSAARERPKPRVNTPAMANTAPKMSVDQPPVITDRSPSRR